MRVLPAHLADAKSMAKDFHDFIVQVDGRPGLTDLRFPVLTLQQTQECLAKLLGYASWRDFREHLEKPHQAVYLDQVENKQYQLMLDAIEARAQTLYDHREAEALTGLMNWCGCVGYSARARAAHLDHETPWDTIQSFNYQAPGVRFVSTSGHGGFVVSDEIMQSVPPHLAYEGGFYEEDWEYHLLAFALPHLAEQLELDVFSALKSVGVVQGDDPREASELDDSKLKVINYLAMCVRANRLPIRFPGESLKSRIDPQVFGRTVTPSLNQWMTLLNKVPTIDGQWATRPGPWFEHWGSEHREEGRQRALNIIDPVNYPASNGFGLLPIQLAMTMQRMPKNPAPD